MLTTEQYNSIMRQRAMPIINACITTRDNPNAATYFGQTTSTKNQYYSFDTSLVEKYRDSIIDIYRDLPRCHETDAPYGYVAFENFFTNTTDPKRQQFELKLANAFINLSYCAKVIVPMPLRSKDNIVYGANAEVSIPIQTRQKEKGGAKREPGDE